MNIFALWGEIEINRQKAETDIKAVEKQATSSGKKMETSFGRVTKVVSTAINEIGKYGKRVEKTGTEISKTFGVPLAALTALMGGLAKSTADYGDQMAKNAQEVGLNVGAYQELNYALGQNNLNQEDSLRILGRLNQRVGLARSGNENYRKSLKKMGVDLEALDKGLIGTEEAFGHILEYLSEIPDSQLQAAYASDIFGTQLSRKMMPMIRAGAEGIAELRDRAHELGIVMDEEATRRAEQFGDTMSDLKGTMGGFNRSIGKELFAPLMNIANWMMEIISAGTEWVKENPKLVRQIIIWGGAIAGVLGVLFTLGTTLVITGKIIGALGTVMGILTSKPFLIIAALGLLWLAWESDWGNIRTTTEKAWAVIKPILDAVIEWGHQTISTVWNWTTETTSKFLTWVSETAWPWIGGKVSTAWDWTTGVIGDFITWIKDVAWPLLNGAAKTTWDWSKGHWDSFVEWLYAQWGFIVNGLTTIWSWSSGFVDKFITWIKDTAWPVIANGASTAWEWTLGKVDDFIAWVKDVAWPWINGTVKTTWEWTVKGLDWLRDMLGLNKINVGPSPEAEYAENLQHAIGATRAKDENLWGEYAEMYARIWDVDEDDIRKALGLDAIQEAVAEARKLDDVLDAIYRAEGGAAARIPYGMTSFADREVSYKRAKDNERFSELSAGTLHRGDEYWRASAQTTVEMWWDHFTELFPQLAGKHFDDVTADIQQLFLVYLGNWFANPNLHELNKNWIPNVSEFLGFDEMSKTFKGDFWNTFETLVDVIYEMADGDLTEAVQYMAQVVADHLMGQSPPPEGPLANIDEGGANVMSAWIGGAEGGLKDGVPVLSSMLEKIRGLFSSIWDKVPEDIKAPIETAIGYIGGLIDQAEGALWKLDELEQQLGDAFGTGGDPGGQAQGFMDRLTAGLNDKLDQLDAPMERFTNAVYQAGGTLFEFGKALASGNWLDAFLIILMETESFAKAMELLGAVLDPVIALFDAILKPIINGLLKLWNGIIDALASISIFGWKPFEGLKDKRIGLIGEGDKNDTKEVGRGGRQISEITGPTRDLLVDLLSPLASFGQIIAPIQDIRNILYERLPNFGNMDFAGAGAGGAGGVVFEPGSIVINSSATNSRDLTRDLLDEIERGLANRIAFGIRGRGGR